MDATAAGPRVGFLRYSYTLGVAAMEGRGFYYPVDLDIAPNGRLYVLGRSHEGDTRGVQVCMTDHDGGYHGVFGSIGEADGQFTWASAIVIDGEGLVYVSDEYLNRISIFDESGRFLRKWGVPGAGEGELDGPSGMALDADQHLWVVDHRNARLQRFTRGGHYLSGFGAGGVGDGQMKLPWGVTASPGGDLYVADWGNDRVLRFTPDGEYVRSYGGSGSEDGQLLRPSSVAVDGAGCVYVADWGNNRVQVFDPEGGFVCAVMGEATLSPWARDYLNTNVEEKEARDRSDLEPDVRSLGVDAREEPYHVEKRFWAPVSVKLDGGRRLLVTDRNRHRIQVYELTASAADASAG